jgi:hypothetical protein
VLDLCFFAEKRSVDAADVVFYRWQAVCTAFSVRHCYVIDLIGHPFRLRGLNTPATVIQDLSELPRGIPRVFVEHLVPTNRVPVEYRDFVHPEEAVYCFGSDSRGMLYAWHEAETDLVGDWISIPSMASLWAEQAAAVVLADRYSKCQ